MILIASGAYVISEFQVELGRIPPCLLPIANKKLLELQVSALRKSFDDDIFLSLPESYDLSVSEKKIIESLGVNVVFVPDAFNLCESLLYVLNTSEQLRYDENIILLHGDTYISDFNNLKKNDVISLSKTNDSYNWEVVKRTEEFALVWSGFFSFSSIKYLLKSLTLNSTDFVNAIHYYSNCKAINYVQCDDWYDMGHTNTYFNSRANVTTQRSFNDLKISDGIVRKTGKPNQKIIAEATWFEKAPPYLKKYIPVLLEHGAKGENYYYHLEYLPYMPLNELYVHGKNETLQWNKILSKLNDYICVSFKKDINDESKVQIEMDAHELYVTKSIERFNQYLNTEKIDINSSYIYKNKSLPSLKIILDDCIEKALGLKVISGIMHGDLCFSNILFDSRGERIKVIDPRGLNYDSELTNLGDLKYDFAKLTHSIVGMYDYIISGYYRLEESAHGSMEIVFDLDKRTSSVIENYINGFKVNIFKVKDIMPLVVLLFFSMLPLHSDRPDRQKAMFYNGLRLYKEYVL